MSLQQSANDSNNKITAANKQSIKKSKYIKAYKELIYRLTGLDSELFFVNNDKISSDIVLNDTFIKQILAQTSTLSQTNKQLNNDQSKNEEKLNNLTIKFQDDKLQLLSKRKSLLKNYEYISKDNIQSQNSNRAQIFNELFGVMFISNPKNYRDEFIQEQLNNELILIDKCVEYIRQLYDQLPISLKQIDSLSVRVQIESVIELISDSRYRLGLLMKEYNFIQFLIKHIEELEEIILMFNKRIDLSHNTTNIITDDNSPITLSLLPYEKYLLSYRGSSEQDKWIYTYEKQYDREYRLLLSHLHPIVLTRWNGIDDIHSSCLFCPIEMALRVIFISSKQTNNIVFISLPHAKGPDWFNFFSLEKIEDNKRYWKLESHLSNIIRQFQIKYLKKGGEFFKKYYKEIFGHNNYITNWEQQIELKQYDSWKQFKILHENLHIVGDELLIGELLRKIIHDEATFNPQLDIDVIPDAKEAKSVQIEFERYRKKINKGLPPRDEETEDWLMASFSSYRDWNEEQAFILHKKRWKDWIGK